MLKQGKRMGMSDKATHTNSATLLRNNLDKFVIKQIA